MCDAEGPLLQELLAQAGIGFAEVDEAAGLYVRVNDTFSRMLGYAREELVGRSPDSVTHPDDVTSDAALRARLQAGVQPRYTSEKRYLRRDGGVVWARVSASRREGPGGARFVALVEDVTDLRRAGDAIRSGEQRMATVLRTSSSGMLLVRSSDWRIVEANDAFVKTLGWTRDDLVGKTTEEVGLYADAETRALVIDQFGRTGGVDGVEVRARHKTGEIGTYLLTVGTAQIGGARCAVGFFEDVTELRRVGKALLESENDLRAMFDLAPVGIVQADLGSGRLLRTNAAMQAITGYSAEELRAMRIAEITHPDDRERDVARLEEIARGGATGGYFEKRYLRKDGRVAHCSVTLRALPDAHGRRSRGVAIIVDETERRAAEAERRLQITALHAASNAIVITDRRGRVHWVNDAFSRVTGYAADEVVGRSLSILRSGAQGEAFYAELWSTILSGRSWQGELVNRTKVGSLYTEEMTITPVRDETGEITHFIAIKQDVTRQRATEEKARTSQRLESIGRLAGGVAHDFNNLLGVILAYSELAADALPPEHAIRDDLSEISQAARRAASLTRQLLAFSRRQVLEPVLLDLDDLLEGLTKMLHRLIGEDIQLTVSADEGEHLTKVDRSQIEQVVMNLVVNARDAMPEGGMLSIRLANVALLQERAATLELAPGDYVELMVTDSGSGIAPDVLGQIFEPFFTTKPQGKGTGLGLAMVHGIVKQSGGGISVDSEPGRGTSFHVLLPRQRDAEAGVTAIDAKPGARVAPHGDEAILLVEDETALRNAMKRSLISAGYDVTAAADASEALLICERNGSRFQLIVTDVVMPGMNGCEMAERLAPLCPDAPVLFLSGYTDDMIAHHGVLKARLLRKPFDPDTLAVTVRAVLDDAE